METVAVCGCPCVRVEGEMCVCGSCRDDCDDNSGKFVVKEMLVDEVVALFEVGVDSCGVVEFLAHDLMSSVLCDVVV